MFAIRCTVDVRFYQNLASEAVYPGAVEREKNGRAKDKGKAQAELDQPRQIKMVSVTDQRQFITTLLGDTRIQIVELSHSQHNR